jgi:cysteine desulfurase
MIYLDHNATTPCHPSVVAAMLPWFTEQFANPSSKHALGQDAHGALGAARKEVARMLGGDPRGVIFTSGATESIHMAILGLLSRQRHTVISTVVEHPATLLLLERLEASGQPVIRLPVDCHGELDLDLLDMVLGLHTKSAILSLLWANNETGVLFPIDTIAAQCRRHDVLLHVDATQAVGKVPIDLHELPVDLLSFSAHKIQGPKGVGVLHARRGLDLMPLLSGHQEAHRRGGTENLPGIVGLAQAARLVPESLSRMPEVAALRDRLERACLQLHREARVNGAQAPRVANTCNITFPGIEAEALLMLLEQYGVIASQGAACVAGETEPSHVLRAMGLSHEQALSSVRFSLSAATTALDIEQAISALAAGLAETTNQCAIAPYEVLS